MGVGGSAVTIFVNGSGVLVGVALGCGVGMSDDKLGCSLGNGAEMTAVTVGFIVAGGGLTTVAVGVGSGAELHPISQPQCRATSSMSQYGLYLELEDNVIICVAISSDLSVVRSAPRQ